MYTCRSSAVTETRVDGQLLDQAFNGLMEQSAACQQQRWVNHLVPHIFVKILTAFFVIFLLFLSGFRFVKILSAFFVKKWKASFLSEFQIDKPET